MQLSKILIISNHCISEYDSNGRSLMNMLYKFDKSQLYQIYSANDLIDEHRCAEYFKITNVDALKGCFGLHKTYSALTENIDALNSNVYSAYKNSLTMLIRDIIWKLSWGMMRSLKKWVKKISPTAIVVQLGDSSYLINIALYLSKCFDIPIVVYNTEDYYFKKYNFMKGVNKSNTFFKLFQANFRSNVRKLINKASLVFCNCNGLVQLFNKEFNIECKTIYTASTIKPEIKQYAANNVISYCGNLGVGRHKSLIELAESLHEIDEKLSLDVYGNAPNKLIAKQLNECKAINFHGVVPYSKVQEVMFNSRLLIHVEGFDSYTVMDTQYAFSTKLADYCASGVPFLIYAPQTGEGMKYVAKNNIGFTVSNRENLTPVLKQALFDDKMIKQVVDNAIHIAKLNHNIENNGQFVYNEILKIISK